MCLITLPEITVQANERVAAPCAVSRKAENIILPEETSIAGYERAILDFLVQSGKPDELEAILIDRALAQRYRRDIRPPLNEWFQNRGGVRTADFNGDGYLDVAVSIFEPTAFFGGGLFVYLCDGQTYRELVSPLDFALDPNTHAAKANYIDRAPKFLFVGDMNQDGRAELVVDIGVTGATTIWMAIEIFGWNDDSSDMRPLNADEESYPASDGFAKVVNAEDGSKAVVVRTGFSGSGPASGPQRQFTITYRWNGSQFVIADAVGDPSNNRLHVAYDALSALNRGELRTATILYNAVLKNNTLKDWNDNADLRNILRAQAAYGLVLIRAKEAGIRSRAATDAYQQFQMLGSELVEINSLWFKYGEVFWQTAYTTDDLGTACEAVNEAIQTDIEALPSDGPHGIRELGLWPWFTYNINWMPTDRGLSFCPF